MNAAGSGRGSGRGRGGNPSHRGRGKPHHSGPRSSAPPRISEDNAQNSTPHLPSRLELEVESVDIPHAFEASCAHVKRCRERGRVFRLPVAKDRSSRHISVQFAVVERTIGGIDDIVYSKHREVWERLPRGNARVYVRNTEEAGSAYKLVGAANGLRKFGYSDSDYGYPADVKTVIAIEKENGECGHIAAFTLPRSAATADAHRAEEDDTSNRFWIVGSKNVHVVLDYAISEACLAYYAGLGRRYTYAVKIARLWRSMLPGGAAQEHNIEGTASASAAATNTHRLTAAQALRFHTILDERKWTSCFEAIFADSQHLVDYEGANELRFYAITPNARAFEARNGDSEEDAGAAAVKDGPQYSREDGLCLSVKDAAAVHTEVGLAFSHHSNAVVYNSADYASLLDDIGRRPNSEGCVMYGADATGKVVRLWKEKSYPYVMERATREAITNHKRAGSDLAEAMRKKLRQQKPELRSYFTEWEATRMPWLLHFAAWLQVTRRLTPSQQRDELFSLRNRWLTLQKEFQADLDRDPELYDVCGQYQPDPVQWGSDTKDLDVVKFVGAQGCGKSTLSRAFYALLQKANYRPRWVNQDESGNRNKFLASLRQATHAEAGVTHLLIDKMNLDARMNHDYDNLPLSLTVSWYHPDGENALYNVCIERVLGRGSGHRTIRIDPTLSPQERQAEERNIRAFVRKAVHACEAPQDSSEVLLELDITAPLEEMVRMMWNKLQESGTNTLPAITDADIAEAIALAHRYEALLRDLPKAPLYACIGLPDAKEVEKLLSLVPQELLEGQVVQSEFHVTTKFFGGETDPVMFVLLAERLGQSVTVTLETVVADGDGVAVTVRKDDASFPCANPIAHITIANRKGVPPRYSNELISETAYPGDRQQRKVVQLPAGTTVTGVFQFR